MDESTFVFGDAVQKHFAAVANQRGLQVAGFVGRPLYSCTAVNERENRLCGKLAAMSPLLQFSEEARHWYCQECESKAAVSAATPRRVIRLYLLVKTDARGMMPGQLRGHTPLRQAPLDVVVTAPPRAWQWNGTVQLEPLSGSPPAPKKQAGLYHYTPTESDCIWQASAKYRN